VFANVPPAFSGSIISLEFPGLLPIIPAHSTLPVCSNSRNYYPLARVKIDRDSNSRRS
jgi:hypothetical protein